MVAPVLKVFTSPAAGPLASGVALALAVTLGLSWAQQARERAAYETRLAEFGRKADASALYWQARYSACRASSPAAPREGAVTKVATSPQGQDAASRLVSQQPAGFDVCARMEAADEAVLASLHK